MPWDRAKLEDEKRRRLPVETATVKRHFEALQSLKVDVIKQQRLEEATFIVRSKALLKRSSDLGSEVVRNLEVGLHVRVLERRGNRVRLEDGWTSIVSQGGTVLLEMARDNSAAKVMKPHSLIVLIDLLPAHFYDVGRGVLSLFPWLKDVICASDRVSHRGFTDVQKDKRSASEKQVLREPVLQLPRTF